VKFGVFESLAHGVRDDQQQKEKIVQAFNRSLRLSRSARGTECVAKNYRDYL
jgi:hypothetical protein